MLKYLRQHGYYLSPGAGINLISLVAVVLRGIFLNLLVWLPLFVLFFLFGMWWLKWLWGLRLGTPVLTRVFGADIDALRLPRVAKRLPELFGFELFLWLGALLLAAWCWDRFYSVISWFRRGASDKTRRTWYELRRWSERKHASFCR